MKSALYKVVQDPHSGWNVKEVKREGILKHFETEEEAEAFLKEIAITTPKSAPVVVNIADGENIAPVEEVESVIVEED